MNSLPSYGDVREVWCENTKASHGHGGQGWEFGTCLWSPTRDRGGGDSYKLMRQPQTGDLVIHFLEDTWEGRSPHGRLAGRSIVASPFSVVEEEPPSPGAYKGMSPFYRIELRDFQPFDSPPSLETFTKTYREPIRAEIERERPKYYPFDRYRDGLRAAMGTYLTKCTPELYAIFREALEIEMSEGELDEKREVHEEYAESLRKAREQSYFSRNPRLVRAAKEHYGYECRGCGFDFEDAYGKLGREYIECHHLVPLSERSDLEPGEEVYTRLEEVTVLCSNCHRMVHRQRPALALDDLRAVVRVEHRYS